MSRIAPPPVISISDNFNIVLYLLNLIVVLILNFITFFSLAFGVSQFSDCLFKCVSFKQLIINIFLFPVLFSFLSLKINVNFLRQQNQYRNIYVLFLSHSFGPRKQNIRQKCHDFLTLKYIQFKFMILLIKEK